MGYAESILLDTGCSQLTAWAKAIAVRRLPTPFGPTNNRVGRKLSRITALDRRVRIER
jgi:hypothetical protein